MQNDRFLIIDKNVDTAWMLKEYLNTLGFDRIYISSGQALDQEVEAVDLFNTMFIDGDTILDWLDNGRLPRWCHQLEKTILVHWEYTPQVEALIESLKVDGFLKKPFDIQSIRDVMQR